LFRHEDVGDDDFWALAEKQRHPATAILGGQGFLAAEAQDSR
jgi:hypothetical protein